MVFEKGPGTVHVFADMTSNTGSASDVKVLTRYVDSGVWWNRVREEVSDISLKEDDLLKRCYDGASLEHDGLIGMAVKISKGEGAYLVKACMDRYRYVKVLREYVPKSSDSFAADRVYSRIMPLASKGVVESADDRIMLVRRGDHVDLPGMITTPPGGAVDYIEPERRLESFREALHRESIEEIGLLPSDYVSVYPIAIYRDMRDSFMLSAGYRMRSLLTADRIEERFDSAVSRNGGESKSIWSEEADPDLLTHLLHERGDEMTGSCRAALIFYGKNRFGEEFDRLSGPLLEDKVVLRKVRVPSMWGPG